MTRPFTVEDLYLHRRVDSLHCVDGPERAVCSVSSIDREGDAQRTYFWQFRLDGSSGATQVRTAPVDGGVADQTTATGCI